MSFLNSIIKAGSSLLGGSNSSVLGDLAKTAVLIYTTKKANDSVNRENQKASSTSTSSSSGSGGSGSTSPARVDPGVRLQVDPDPSQKIPVVYGQAVLGGIVTDAVLDPSDRKILYLVFTFCETTGTKLSDGLASGFTFEQIFLNDQRVVFTPGTTEVANTVDRDGNVDRSLADNCEIYCFNGSSLNPVYPTGVSGSALDPAYNIVPGWNSSFAMSNLVFAVVRLTYDSDKGVTSIPNMQVRVRNSMTLPGDCVYDYMTNTRYGAGIPPGEIYSI